MLTSTPQKGIEVRRIKRISSILDSPLELTSINIVESFINTLSDADSESLEAELKHLEDGRSHHQLHYILAMARMYELGLGVEKDYESALELFNLAASYDDSYALMILAFYYWEGTAVEQDVSKAIQYLWLSLLHGCEQSRVSLAEILESESTESASLDHAYWLYLSAAKEGVQYAQWRLGNFYLNGIVVRSDLDKGFKWIFKAASAGLMEAKYQLACSFMNGEKSGLEPKIAYQWLLELADAGYENTYSYLAELSFRGIGCDKSLERAENYYIEASKSGDWDGYVALGKFYLNSDNKKPSYSKAYKSLILPAREGHEEACFLISGMYRNGLGVIASEKMAKSWLPKSPKKNQKAFNVDENIKMESFKEWTKNKFHYYKNTQEASSWLEKNFQRITKLFEDRSIRDFIFEPIKDVFELRGKTTKDDIHAAITRVAVANAVMAGLPGKMGVGVAISIALEAWLAYVIAKKVGINIKSVGDVWKYMGLIAATITTIIWGFKALLGLGFSMFSVIPGLNPMILAELFVTNVVGVAFFYAWSELTKNNDFRVPKTLFKSLWSESKDLYEFQVQILKKNLNSKNLRVMSLKLRAWINGEIPSNFNITRGEILPTVAMAAVLSSDWEKLSGPLGSEFIGAIRDRFPDLKTADLSEISEHMNSYDSEQISGVTNLIKGKLFERLVANAENTDDDNWHANLHEDESNPGSDMILFNDESGESLEISLKATMSKAYIEDSLLKYPDIPIMTTEEISQKFADDDMISGSGIANEEVESITKENFERLLHTLPSATDVSATGVTVGAMLSLWPFVVAYLKKNIEYIQLQQACERVAGEYGVSLASRLSYAVVLGPVFAWYLLARGMISITKSAEENSPNYRIYYQQGSAIIEAR